MSVEPLLKELRRRGIELQAQGPQLRFRPRGAVTPELRNRLLAHKTAILEALRSERSVRPSRADLEEHQRDPELLETFLSNSALPAAILDSKVLNRRFVLAREADSLRALAAMDGGLPVLFFGEAGKLLKLGLQGIRVLLDFRQQFGPSVGLLDVRESRYR